MKSALDGNVVVCTPVLQPLKVGPLDAVNASQMLEDEVNALPPFYASYARAVLRNAGGPFVTDLREQLSKFRTDHEEVARHYREMLERYSAPELKSGREEVLTVFETGADTCDRLVRAATAVLENLPESP